MPSQPAGQNTICCPARRSYTARTSGWCRTLLNTPNGCPINFHGILVYSPRPQVHPHLAIRFHCSLRVQRPNLLFRYSMTRCPHSLSGTSPAPTSAWATTPVPKCGLSSSTLARWHPALFLRDLRTATIPSSDVAVDERMRRRFRYAAQIWLQGFRKPRVRAVA